MAIGIGQKDKKTTTAGTSVVLAPTGSTITGSTFIVGVHCRISTTVSTPTDNKGNTYVQTGTTLNNGFAQALQFRCENGTGGSSHQITVSTSSSVEIVAMFMEVTGAASASLDKTAQANPTASPFKSGATATTAQANELLVGFFCGDSGSNPATHAVSGSTPAAGSWTIQVDETDGSTLWPACLATAIVSATGAYEAGFTETGSSTTGSPTFISTFKESAFSNVNKMAILGVG
jgi:hypothetical protein